MATRNDITGDSIQTKTSSQAYRDNWDAIFGGDKRKVEDFKKEVELAIVEIEKKINYSRY